MLGKFVKRQVKHERVNSNNNTDNTQSIVNNKIMIDWNFWNFFI